MEDEEIKLKTLYDIFDTWESGYAPNIREYKAVKHFLVTQREEAIKWCKKGEEQIEIFILERRYNLARNIQTTIELFKEFFNLTKENFK